MHNNELSKIILGTEVMQVLRVVTLFPLQINRII